MPDGAASPDLMAEWARWQDAGLKARFWLRDDDAVTATPSLERLIAMTQVFDAPLLLAVIPAHATHALAVRLRGLDRIRIATHGWSHRNHAAAGMKQSEATDNLATGRSSDDVLHEIATGHRQIGTLFAAQSTGFFVPPWNRMAPAVAERLGETGVSAISGFGWRRAETPLPWLNTHIDLIDWRNGRSGKSLKTLDLELVTALQSARKRGGAPIGILSHHLVHDDTAWTGYEALVHWIRQADTASLHAAEELVA